MKKQLTTRLQDLKTEYQKGQERLNALEQETTNVRTSMLRISGAIQVLEELLTADEKNENLTSEKQLENGVRES